MYWIGIDVGGTNIAAGLVNESMEIVDRASLKTNLPTTPERIQEDVSRLITELMERNHLNTSDLYSIGVGVPCTANERTGWMADADHLGFAAGPLVEPLRERFGIPVYMGNDANAAAWGEYKISGYDGDSFLLVTLGTGVGGGIILNGKLWSGTNFAAGEFGHMVIRAGGNLCGCGRRGCFETYGSATALIRQAKERMTADRETALWNLCGGDMEKVEAKTVFDGAAAGDTASLELLDRYTEDLAEGIANLVNIFQPGVVCVGGGVSAAGDALLLPLQAKAKPMMFTGNSGGNTQLILARLGNDAGSIGAALLGNEGGI